MTHEHQDWSNVVFKKKQSNTLTNNDIRTSNYKTKARVVSNANNTSNGQKLFKLDNENESFELTKVSRSLSKQIQQARLGNKMTQKELAFKINVSNKIINDYESGKAQPDNTIKMKIQRALNTTFTK